MRLPTICLPFLGALLFNGEISAQCTTCDGQVEVTFRGAMCADGTFTVQLHDKTIGPVTGQGCGAYTPSPDGKVKLKPDVPYTMMISGSKVSTAHMEIDCPQCFKVYIDGEEISTVDESGLGCEAYTGTWTVVLKPATSGSAGAAGDGDISGGSASGGMGGSFSLGGSANGSAGEISFSSGTISPDLFTAGALNYVSVSPDVEVIRDSGTNALRQIKAPETLADIVTISATSYEIRFYPISQVGAKVSGLYQTSGTASKIWRISSPQNSASIPEIKVTEIQGAISKEQVFSAIGGTWLSTIAGLRSESRVETTLGNGDKQVETTVFHPTTSLVVSQVRDVYHAYPWGTEKITSIQDPDGDALTTTWAFHENSGDAANYGRLKWINQPDGSWERYSYYGDGGRSGKIEYVFRPWKNLPASPVDATTANCQLTIYDYASIGYTYFQTEISLVEKRVLGTVVEEKYTWPYLSYLWSWDFPIYEDYPDMDYLPIVTRTDGSYYGRETATIATTSDVPEYLKGRLAYIQEPDGRQEIHTYELGAYIVSTDAFTPSSSGDHLREIVTQADDYHPCGVEGKTLRTVRITSPAGNLLREESQVRTAAGYASLGIILHTYDAQGRLTQTSVKDGGNVRTTYNAVWVNGRLSSETDEQGIVTTFDIYDAEDRVTQETRAGIITSRVYDPMGRLTSTTRSAGGLSLSTATGYDVSGRVTSETREDGLVTSTVYTSGGRIVTRTRPDTATEITTRYLDGQTYSITGTGMVARYFDYGTDANGLWSKESNAAENSLRYSTSWRNLDGDTWRTASNSPSGLIVSQTEFDPYTERVTSRTVPGEAPILFAYDADNGALTRQARDLNGNGIIDLAGPDSIEETQTSYVEEGGAWFKETVNSTYLGDDSPTATALSTSREKLTGLGAGIASVAESIDSQGHVTTRTVAINRATRIVTTTTDVPDSNLDAVEIAVDGLPNSATTPTVSTPTEYDHDALDRLETVTSPRGVVTTTVYDPTTGRISSRVHAGKTTQYAYHPSGGAGAGMVATETRPDTTVIRTSYTLRGEIFRVWGGGAYPLEYSYNSHGQIEALKTFRSDAGWTAATWPASPGTADLTTWTYHPESGQIYQKSDAANKSETLTYHSDGKLQTRQRATGRTTTYAWTNRGQPESVTYNDATPAVFRTYDRAGRAKTTKDAAGTRTFTYPDLLTTTESIAGGILAEVNRSSTLDTYSRRSQSAAGSGSALHAVDYQYSPVSRLDQVVTGTHSATYGYLTDSDLIETITLKSGSTTRLGTTRNHDVSDRLDGVTNAYRSQTQSFGVTEFDGMNRRKKIEREDGTRWAYGYNSKGEVTSGLREKTAAPHTSVPGWQHGYTFDEIGNRLTATTNARVSTYVPNPLNQYDSRTVPRAFDVIGKANSAASVTVDGNPATRLDEFFYKELAAGSGAVHTPYVVQATDANGTTTRSGGKFLPATPENFVYDFDGNLTSDGRFTCTWDAENRLVSMETHASVPLAARRKLAFSYDSMGRRIRKSVWHGVTGGGWQLRHHFDFIHELNGWNILAERSGGSANGFIRTYAWGTDLSGTLSGAGGVGGLLFATLHASGKTFAYGADLNGNITLLVDAATGQSAATYDYGPFGEQIRQSGEYAMLNPYRFSTKYTDDETGWLDYGLRYYDPSTGRWRSRDPIGEEGGQNLNAVAGNNFVGRFDVNGLYVDAGKVATTMGMNGWTQARQLMQKFIAAGSYSLPSTTTTGLSDPFDNSIVTLEWSIGYGRYKTAYEKLKKLDYYKSAGAKANIIKQAKEQTGPYGGDFGYHYVLGGESDMRKVHQTQVQYSPVAGEGAINEYDAALNGFNYYAIVAGCVSKSSSGEVSFVNVKNIGIYLRDSWDFQGYEYLGAWNFSTHAVRRFAGVLPGFTNVFNSDLRDYQTRHGKGGEYWVFSNIENYRVPSPLMISK
jgi:RHS repeat-associated protein